MEVFVGQSGTWTIFVTDVHGTSCIIAAGKSWESVAAPAGHDARY